MDRRITTWSVDALGYHSALTRKDPTPATMWADLEDMVPSGVSQTQDRARLIPLLEGSQRATSTETESGWWRVSVKGHRLLL